MIYIKLFKVNILLLSILLTIQPIAHANNEAITMNKEKILKEINANYTDWDINHYIKLDNDLKFLSVFEEENKQAKDTVNQLQIISLLEKTLKKINVKLKPTNTSLKLEYKRSFQFNLWGNNNRSNLLTPTTHVYKIILANDGNQILGDANIAITISQLEDIKQAYLQTQHRLIFYFDFGYSSPRIHYEKMDNLGTYAAKDIVKDGDFMWIYKNMMVQIFDNNIQELSLKIANMFQEEVEQESKRLHKIP
ncbi:Nin one binding (NOB1) Zn-ribbon-liek protein [Snodgrassella alvi SCGC AB-598-O02]|nr:Nin one binding (NOB1) Zn-ribbon-liek protein [Snodgrassella alvi SCGC AB-598-O02]